MRTNHLVSSRHLGRAMAIMLVFALVLGWAGTASAAVSEWTWVSGSSSTGATRSNGTQGVFAPGNTPGSRFFAATATDASGNMWMFGGSMVNPEYVYGDLWEWNGANWAWIGGTASGYNQAGTYGSLGEADSLNQPPARNLASAWIDVSGNFWMFGGCTGGLTPHPLNDMWKWDGTYWAWMGGASSPNASGVYGTKGQANEANIPGARCGQAMTRDEQGNIWVFGGFGYDAYGTRGRLNDLWKWDGASWTWVAGPDTADTPGSYGSKNVTLSANLPPARGLAALWPKPGGGLWLFGGNAGPTSPTDLNDLWRFDGTNWTWVSGADTQNQLGTYGTLGVPAASNVPGAREAPVAWSDSGGDLWLFGGFGPTPPPLYAGTFNDLWKWDGTTWTWMGGSNLPNQTGVYGIMGTGSASNIPGARLASASWKDLSGNFWLFGGSGWGSTTQGDLSDIWKFEPPLPAVSLSPSSLSFGSQTIGTTSTPQSIVVSNTGDAMLVVSSVTLAGGTDFAISSEDCTSAASIAPGGSCTINATFTPTAEGARSDTLNIAGNFLGSPHSVSLSGNGLPNITPPALVSPKNGAAVYTRKPKLTWKAVTGASLYHVQIDENDDFSSPVPDSDADAPNPTFTPPSALPFGTYYWHVQARVNGVWSEYSMPYTFDVTLHRLPRKNAAIYPRRPEFTWLKVKNASLPYQLHVWDNADCSSDPLLEKTSRKPTYTLARGDALDLGTYSWRVSADGGQTWTPCWRFDVTNLKKPKSWGAVSTTKPTFSWAGNAAATGGYELTVSLHPDDGSPDVVKIDGHPTKKLGYTATANDGLDFGRYLWLVEECAPLCDGDTSGIPARGLYITNMVAPRNDLFTLKGKITFTWKQVTGASTYDLVVSEDPDDLDPAVFNPPATSALKRVSPTLPRGTYYWHIVTSNGKTMPTWTFTVGP